MKLTLVRRWFGPSKTIGKLYVNGRFRYFVLEDLVRRTGEKVPGQTAIPYGRYPVSVSVSPRLGRRLPLIEDVPGFTGIRAHAGIDEAWTEGCVLISRRISGGKLVLDREAEGELTDLIDNALSNGEKVTLKVTNNQRRAFIFFALLISTLLILYVVSKFMV